MSNFRIIYEKPFRCALGGYRWHIQLYNKFIISETAGLLPARYFEQRYKPDWDVRENLFEHQKSQKYSNHWSINAIEDGYQSDQPMGSFETEPEE